MAGDSGGERSSLRILIVEDEFLIADYLSMVIEDAGHEVVAIASKGRDALTILEQDRSVDLVTLDLKIAGDMDGIELATQIRTARAVPFIFFTGSVEPGARQRCEALEPVAILQKPVDPTTLRRFLTDYGTNGSAAVRSSSAE